MGAYTSRQVILEQQLFYADPNDESASSRQSTQALKSLRVKSRASLKKSVRIFQEKAEHRTEATKKVHNNNSIPGNSHISTTEQEITKLIGKYTGHSDCNLASLD